MAAFFLRQHARPLGVCCFDPAAQRADLSSQRLDSDRLGAQSK